MTVKEVFELRKQGRVEEAYEAIRPMYAVHQGHYTTICMFWCASDVLRLRIEQDRTDEALKIFQALVRLYPGMDDTKGRLGHLTLLNHALSLSEKWPEQFSMIDFMENGGLESLDAEDWKPGQVVPTPEEMAQGKKAHPLPSTAARLVSAVHRELEASPTPEQALRCVPVLQEALRHSRNNMHFQRLMALIYQITGETQKAVGIYRELLRRPHPQSYLYSEMAALATRPENKLPLLAKALLTQREERFRTKLHIQLAELLAAQNPPLAAYHLQESIRIRQAGGFHISAQQHQLAQQLQAVQPVSPAEARQQLEALAAQVKRLVN